jgi:hypothetical protein
MESKLSPLGTSPTSGLLYRVFQISLCRPTLAAVHVSSGIRHVPSVRVGEDISFLRQRGHCDRHPSQLVHMTVASFLIPSNSPSHPLIRCYVRILDTSYPTKINCSKPQSGWQDSNPVSRIYTTTPVCMLKQLQCGKLEQDGNHRPLS